MRTEPWWVCRCGVAVAKVGKSIRSAHVTHAKTCSQPGYAIKQLPQKRRTK